jgi:hypothetical protein
MDYLRKADPESPSRSGPDLLCHDAKRRYSAMVPAVKAIFQKIFGPVPAGLEGGVVAKGPLGRVP